MPTTLTGAASDPTTAPTATTPADGDAGNAASVDGPFQSILNFVAWLRGNCATKNMAGGKITNLGLATASGDAVAVGGYSSAICGFHAFVTGGAITLSRYWGMGPTWASQTNNSRFPASPLVTTS